MPGAFVLALNFIPRRVSRIMAQGPHSTAIHTTSTLPVQLSNRVGNVSPSQTLSISALAAQIRARGKDVINLSAGQPDRDTPQFVKQAAIAAISAGKTRYTPVGGTASLKRAIADKMKRENNLDYDAETQVMASCGAKHSLYNVCQALLEEGDEVIIPVPFWVSYPEIVKLAGGRPVPATPGHGHGMKIGPDELRRAVTGSTRLLILNSPNNPSGAAYDERELRALAEVLLEYPGIAVISDDIYEHILFGGRTFSNLVNVCPELYTRTIVINGVSKAYSMTGWRIGYACGPAEVIDAMKKIQSHSTSNPNSIAQEAAQAALEGPQDFVIEMNREFEKRHARIHELLSNIENVKCLPSSGSFYIFPDFSAAIENHPRVDDELALARYLLQEAHVATVPGIAFGMPGYLRVSFSAALESIETGVARIRDAMQA